MEWLNVYGLVFMAVIMVPNVVFAVKCKGGFENKWRNRFAEAAEQIGRVGCFAFMIVNVPGTCFGWRSDAAFAAYIIVNAVLIAAYCAVWAVSFNKGGVARALALSVLPSAVFMFSGIISRSVLLIIAAAIFAASHITISYKNAVLSEK